MKRFSTVLLLFVFLMYQAGFYLFYLSLDHHHEEEWQSAVSLNDLKGQILEKSIPITFAYQPEQQAPQSVMKSIEINGRIYQDLSQRYENETLHVFYMVDNSRQNMHSSLKSWVNTIAQQSNQDKKSGLKDGLEKNYMPNEIHFDLYNSYVFNSVYGFLYTPGLLNPSADTLKPPPKS